MASSYSTIYNPSLSETAATTGLLNQMNVANQATANTSRFTGEAGLEQKSSSDIMDQLSGKVGSDTLSLLEQQAAERGISSGIGADSGASQSSYLKALGLTSTGQIEKGMANLTAATNRNPVAQTVDASKFTLTPEQLSTLQQNALNAQNQQNYNSTAQQLQQQLTNQAQVNALRGTTSTPTYTGPTNLGNTPVTTGTGTGQGATVPATTGNYNISQMGNTYGNSTSDWTAAPADTYEGDTSSYLDYTGMGDVYGG